MNLAEHLRQTLKIIEDDEELISAALTHFKEKELITSSFIEDDVIHLLCADKSIIIMRPSKDGVTNTEIIPPEKSKQYAVDLLDTLIRKGKQHVPG